MHKLCKICHLLNQLREIVMMKNFFERKNKSFSLLKSNQNFTLHLITLFHLKLKKYKNIHLNA
jgi:hypothetical protein